MEQYLSADINHVSKTAISEHVYNDETVTKYKVQFCFPNEAKTKFRDHIGIIKANIKFPNKMLTINRFGKIINDLRRKIATATKTFSIPLGMNTSKQNPKCKCK